MTRRALVVAYDYNLNEFDHFVDSCCENALILRDTGLHILRCHEVAGPDTFDGPSCRGNKRYVPGVAYKSSAYRHSRLLGHEDGVVLRPLDTNFRGEKQ